MKPISMILLLTNRPSNENVLARHLSKDSNGYQVAIFDGIESLLEGLDAEGNPQSLDLRPCLIVLDWTCPDNECIRVLARLKADSRIQKVPVLIAAEQTDAEQLRRCYELNANFYLLKPGEAGSLRAFLDHLGQFLALDGVKLPQIRHRWSAQPAGVR